MKKTSVAQRMKNTRAASLVMQSVGDWRYPFMLGSWWLSSVLVPRRKISVGDVSFTLSCTNWITHFRWYLFKRKEPEVRYYIDKYVKDGDIFFDIGANVGVFSIYTAIRYPNISIYCFEPEYSNLNALKENIVCNKMMHKANIYSVAISNFIGFSKLHLQDITTGSACHTESRKPINLTHEGYPVVWTEGIVSVTLDYLCEQLGVIPNAIKIDTDGNEDKVLEGAVKTLSNSNLRSLVIEMPHENKGKSDLCYEILKSAGLYLAWSNREKTRNEIWIRQ
ncbi:MAG: FkbM family methyltransferase [Candidatus Brocadiaceae bacterium]|nr:FkbM family methyltransferase [Candidatus Brocadiaceae bacterium]